MSLRNSATPQLRNSATLSFRLSDLLHFYFGPQSFRRTKVRSASSAVTALESRKLLDGDGSSVIPDGYGDGSSVISGNDGNGGGVGYGSGYGSASTSGTGGTGGTGGGTGQGSGGASGSASAPIAYDDEVFVYHGAASGNVLIANGTSLLNSGLGPLPDQYYGTPVLTVTRAPSTGSITFSQDYSGWWTWTPNANSVHFVGTDSFEYKLTEYSTGQSDTATVTINFLNNAPVAGVASGYEVVKDSNSSPMFSVAGHAFDPEGDSFKYSSTSPGVQMFDDGTFYYVPPTGVSGLQSLTYTATDFLGAASTAPLLINISLPTVSILTEKAEFRETSLDPAAIVDQRNVAIFRVSRNTIATTPLVVEIEYDGPTARFTGPNSVTIPAGVTSVQLHVLSINDTIVQLQERELTTATVKETADYVLGSSWAGAYLYDNDGYHWESPKAFEFDRDRDVMNNQPISTNVLETYVSGLINVTTGTWEGRYGSGFTIYPNFGGWLSELTTSHNHEIIGTTIRKQFYFDRTGKIWMDNTGYAFGKATSGDLASTDYFPDPVISGKTVTITYESFASMNGSEIDGIVDGLLSVPQSRPAFPGVVHARIVQTLVLVAHDIE